MRGRDEGWPTTPWDVTTWTLGSRLPYRINSFYGTDRAVVTVTGLVQTPDAVAELIGMLHVFDLLPAPVVVDLCHATLDDRAADAVVAARRRSGRGGGGRWQVAWADPVTELRLSRAEQAAAPTDDATG